VSKHPETPSTPHNPRLSGQGRSTDGGNGRESLVPEPDFAQSDPDAPFFDAPYTSKPPVHGPNWFVLLLTSLAVGATVGWLTQPGKQLALPLKADAPIDPANAEALRAAINEFAGRYFDLDSSSPRWWTEQAGPQTLHLKVQSGDRSAASRPLQEFANTFPRAWRERIRPAAMAQTPDAIRRTTRREFLQNQIADLRADLADPDSVATAGVEDERQAKLQEYRNLHVTFAALRQQVMQTTEQLAQMREAPEPAFGIVSAEQRRKALADDAVLQQELAELTVRLTELKREALAVWQDSMALLDALRSASQQMSAAGSQASLPDAGEALRAVLTEIKRTSQRFDEALEAFATTWTRDFTIVRDYEIDARNDELIQTYSNVRRTFNEFSFRADKSLATLRAAIDQLGSSSADDARFHVLHSDLKRAAQSIIQAFRRWELEARMMIPSHNFRLDAALRSARGLHRRTARRIAAIDEHLQEIAVQRAREKAHQELQQTTVRLNELRDEWDVVTGRLVDCQQELNRLTDQAIANATTSAKRTTLQSRLTRLQDELSSLALPPGTAGEAADASLPATFRPQEIISIAPPHAVSHRLQTGGIAAGVTFFLLGSLRLLTTRRATSRRR